jgi:GDP-L-fucose synthase
VVATVQFGVIGGTGFLGTHVTRRLAELDFPAVVASRRTGDDARDARQLIEWIADNSITHVINLAAECGGIGLNRERPADLWLASTKIGAAVLEAVAICSVDKLTLIGTVCSYAADTPTPFQESDLMYYGFPEYTNSAYWVSKLAAYFGARAYRGSVRSEGDLSGPQGLRTKKTLGFTQIN